MVDAFMLLHFYMCFFSFDHYAKIPFLCFGKSGEKERKRDEILFFSLPPFSSFRPAIPPLSLHPSTSRPRMTPLAPGRPITRAALPFLFFFARSTEIRGGSDFQPRDPFSSPSRGPKTISAAATLLSCPTRDVVASLRAKRTTPPSPSSATAIADAKPRAALPCAPKPSTELRHHPCELLVPESRQYVQSTMHPRATPKIRRCFIMPTAPPEHSK